MSEAAAKPGGSRLPQPQSRAIPRPKPVGSSQLASRPLTGPSHLASGRVTRQSLSAPDLSKVGVAAKPVRGAAPLLRKAVATAALRATQPSTAAASRKRPAPAPQPAPGPVKKRPLVETKQIDKVPASTNAPVKRGKPAPWDIKAKLEHANERIAKLSQENDYLTKASEEAVSLQHELLKMKEVCATQETQITDLASQLETVTQSDRNSRAQAANAQKELDKIRIEAKSLTDQLNSLKSKLDTVCKSEQDLKVQVANLSEESKTLTNMNSALTAELEACKKAANLKDQERLEQIFNDQQIKRSMLNQILDLKGNIRVFCRVRPPLDHERNKILLSFNFPNEAAVEVKLSEKGLSKQQPEKKLSFSYDKVFSATGTQEDIFEELSALVQSALDGHNVCVFAYGQTGSGKTYTMQGGTDSESQGMIPRSVKVIFDSIEQQNKLGWEYTVRCSFMEIYNENIRDLLNPNSKTPHEIKKVDPNSEDVYVSNLKIEVVDSEASLQKLLLKAQNNRFTAATIMNDVSSRSHSITQIKIEGYNKAQNLRCQGTLNLIDLAGSEKYRSENETDRKAETVKINRSLQTLSLVVLKLAEKAEHIPFRDSKLTHILMPSLKGNSKTLMMVNISPFEDCQNDTVSSLRFASRVSNVKVDCKRQIKSSLSQNPVPKPSK